MFTEAIIQKQGSKSRAPINKTAHSHKQLLFDVQLHARHSRHAWSQTASFQFSQTQPLSNCLSVSLTFPLSQKHNYSQKYTETWLLTHLLLTSTKELQVADLFSDLQLENLLEDLLPQRLLDDSHPL